MVQAVTRWLEKSLGAPEDRRLSWRLEAATPTSQMTLTNTDKMVNISQSEVELMSHYEVGLRSDEILHCRHRQTKHNWESKNW